MVATRCFLTFLALGLSAGPAAAQPKLRLDRLGDPLPPGAIGRLGTTRLQHRAYILNLAFLPGGKTLAALGTDGAIQTWDPATGKERTHYQIETRIGVSPAFSPDGKLLAKADDSGFTLFDLATGREIYRHGPLSGNRDRFCDFPVAFSGDGRFLVHMSQAHDHVYLHEVSTGKALQTLQLKKPAQQFGTPSLTLSPDGKLLVTPAMDQGDGNDFAVWDLASGERLYEFRGSTWEGQLIFTPDGKRFGTIASDWTKVVLREAATGKKLHTFAGANLLAFAPDGKTLAIAAGDQVHLLDAQSFKKVWTQTSKDHEIRRLAFSPDSRHLATIEFANGTGNILRLRRLRDGVESWQAILPNWNGQCVFADDGATLALATSNTIRLWDVATGHERYGDARHYDALDDFVFTPDGRQITTISADGMFRVWDPATQVERARSIIAHRAESRLVLDADGKTVFSCTIRVMTCMKGNVLTVCDAATGRAGAGQVNGPPGASHGCAVAPDGQTVLWQARDGKLDVFDVATQKQTLRLAVPDGISVPMGGGVFAPDGRQMAAIGTGLTSCKLWQCDMTTGRELPPVAGLTVPLSDVAYTPDSRLLAGLIRPADGHSVAEMRLWEVATGQECLRIETPGKIGQSLAFAPDGRRLALGCRDGTICVLDVATGKLLGCFDGRPGHIGRLRFAPDGKTLLSAGGDATVLIWDMTLFPAPPAGLPAPGMLDKCWADLAGTDAANAYHAIWVLRAPKQAIPFLNGKLKPIAPPDTKEIRRWIAELDSDEYEVRQAAHQRLAVLGKAREPAIKAALMGNASLELRRRLQQLATLKPPVLSNQIKRAIQALELSGTAEARTLLHALAQGEAGRASMREAQESLDRLNKREAHATGR